MLAVRNAVKCFQLIHGDQAEQGILFLFVSIYDNIVQKALVVVYCATFNGGSLIRMDNKGKYWFSIGSQAQPMLKEDFFSHAFCGSRRLHSHTTYVN